MLDQGHVDYEVVDAEEQAELTKKLGIKQAPTLVAQHGSEVEMHAGVSAIKQFIDRN